MPKAAPFVRMLHGRYDSNRAWAKFADMKAIVMGVNKCIGENTGFV